MGSVGQDRCERLGSNSEVDRFRVEAGRRSSSFFSLSGAAWRVRGDGEL